MKIEIKNKRLLLVLVIITLLFNYIQFFETPNGSFNEAFVFFPLNTPSLLLTWEFGDSLHYE
jgi:hypothetical protein